MTMLEKIESAYKNVPIELLGEYEIEYLEDDTGFFHKGEWYSLSEFYRECMTVNGIEIHATKAINNYQVDGIQLNSSCDGIALYRIG